MRHKPQSIGDIGLRKFMQQRGVDYDEFVRRYELNEPKTIIARAFGVDRRTVDKWIAQYLTEQTRNA